MNTGVNDCRFIGRLGRDVELQYTAGGTAIAKFSLAVDMRGQNKETGEYETTTTWVDLTAFGKLAETLGKIGRKGALLATSNEFQMTPYVDKEDGKKKYFRDFIVRDFSLLSSPKRKAEGEAEDTGFGYTDVEPESMPF